MAGAQLGLLYHARYTGALGYKGLYPLLLVPCDHDHIAGAGGLCALAASGSRPS